jgi:hypothetical protein
MIGTQDDIVSRLKAVLPVRWFGDGTPILDGLLGGLAAGWSWVYGLLTFVIAQNRIASATGLWIDLIAHDYFGSRLTRRGGESDASLRLRVQREINRERGTRGAIIAVLEDLTGRVPVIFEPARPADTGAWGIALAYGQLGGWGSLALPYQCFVTAYRPQRNGIALVLGWGTGAGGYGVGSIEYGSLAMSEGQVTDSDINAAIADVLPVACTAWAQIAN